MGMRWPLSTSILCGAAAMCFQMLAAAPAQAAEVVAVAGVQPDRRPEGAPVIKQFAKSPEWYAAAAAGVTQPLPPSLRFLDDQGAWFTPFTRPGMPGRYDLRGLHGSPATQSSQSKK